MYTIPLCEHGDVLSRSSALRYEQAATVELRVRQYVELAVKTCGSAASLARRLNVTSATVCQWRTGRRKPDAVHLLCIQDLAATQTARETEQKIQRPTIAHRPTVRE